MSDKLELYAVPDRRGMAVYLRDRTRQGVYVISHQENQALFHYLRCGCSMRDVRSYRPGRNRAQQKMAKSLEYVICVAKWVVAEEISA